MKIIVTYGRSRPKPRVGDRKMVCDIEHIRVLKFVTDINGIRIGTDCTGGRQRYQWVPVSEARAYDAAHHWTPAERLRYDAERSSRHAQVRGAA